MSIIKKAYRLYICIFCLELFSLLWMFSGLILPGTIPALSATGHRMFKYFTVDSNVLMGVVALVIAINLKKIIDGKLEALSKKHYIYMLMGTASVTLTMLVTVFYLAPTMKNGWLICFGNSNLFLHLINPLVSIIAFVCYEKTNRLSFKDSVFGIIPMCVYAVYYVLRAVTHSANGYVLPGYDFYNFFAFGLKSGFVVVPLITLITFAISICLYKMSKINCPFNEQVTTESDLIKLIDAQQGEMDAVLMYQKIAEKINDEEVKKIILDTAADEGKHAAVFHNITGAVLKPKKFKSVFVPVLISIIGKRKAFAIIAKQEYAAEKAYVEVVEKYPVVANVQKDEHIHGDRMMGVSNRY